MLQKTKILNLLEKTFTTNERTFTSTEFMKATNLVLNRIKTVEEYDYKIHRGLYGSGLYNYNSWLFNSSKREPRYINKVSRGVFQICGPLVGDLDNTHSHTPIHSEKWSASALANHNKAVEIYNNTTKKEVCEYITIKASPLGPAIGDILEDCQMVKEFPEYFEKYIPMKTFSVTITSTSTYTMDYVEATTKDGAYKIASKNFHAIKKLIRPDGTQTNYKLTEI